MTACARLLAFACLVLMLESCGSSTTASVRTTTTPRATTTDPVSKPLSRAQVARNERIYERIQEKARARAHEAAHRRAAAARAHRRALARTKILGYGIGATSAVFRNHNVRNRPTTHQVGMVGVTDPLTSHHRVYGFEMFPHFKPEWNEARMLAYVSRIDLPHDARLVQVEKRADCHIAEYTSETLGKVTGQKYIQVGLFSGEEPSTPFRSSAIDDVVIQAYETWDEQPCD